jgi:hypothetical protein
VLPQLPRLVLPRPWGDDNAATAVGGKGGGDAVAAAVGAVMLLPRL